MNFEAIDSHKHEHTVWPKRLDPFYIVTYILNGSSLLGQTVECSGFHPDFDSYAVFLTLHTVILKGAFTLKKNI